MVDFDALNRQTRKFNVKNVDRFDSSNSHNGYNFNGLNNKTFHSNNGQYSSYYSNH